MLDVSDPTLFVVFQRGVCLFIEFHDPTVLESSLSEAECESPAACEKFHTCKVVRYRRDCRSCILLHGMNGHLGRLRGRSAAFVQLSYVKSGHTSPG
jgi:hypothetical protein